MFRPPYPPPSTPFNPQAVDPSQYGIEKIAIGDYSDLQKALEIFEKYKERSIIIIYVFEDQNKKDYYLNMFRKIRKMLG